MHCTSGCAATTLANASAAVLASASPGASAAIAVTALSNLPVRGSSTAARSGLLLLLLLLLLLGEPRRRSGCAPQRCAGVHLKPLRNSGVDGGSATAQLHPYSVHHRARQITSR
jgi:hypothetical protein